MRKCYTRKATTLSLAAETPRKMNRLLELLLNSLEDPLSVMALTLVSENQWTISSDMWSHNSPHILTFWSIMLVSFQETRRNIMKMVSRWLWPSTILVIFTSLLCCGTTLQKLMRLGSSMFPQWPTMEQSKKDTWKTSNAQTRNTTISSNIRFLSCSMYSSQSGWRISSKATKRLKTKWKLPVCILGLLIQAFTMALKSSILV